MKPREAVLERRRQYLQAKIAAQRAQLAWQLAAFERPLSAFETARSVGETVRRHAALVGGAATVLGFILMRGGIFSKSLRLMKVANFATKWLALARLGLHLKHRWQGQAF